MRVLRVIKAPLGVQLNRAAFLIYTAFFSWPCWHWRQKIVVSGIVIFGSFIFCSLLGLGYSFIRIRRSRWIMAVLGLAIPAAFWTLMLPMFSRPAWWEWPLDIVLLPVLWMGIPVMLAIALFRDKKTSEYFTTSVA
jgi:hypothetical protein